MLLPLQAYSLRVKETFPPQTPFIKERLCPGPQGASHECADRYPKPHLGSFDKMFGDIAVKHLPEKPFPLSVADLHLSGEPPGELHDMVIKIRSARLKAYTHAGPVYLDRISSGR